MENPVRKHVDPDQMPHYVASDLGLHCLAMTLFMGFQLRQGWPGNTDGGNSQQ